MRSRQVAAWTGTVAVAGFVLGSVGLLGFLVAGAPGCGPTMPTAAGCPGGPSIWQALTTVGALMFLAGGATAVAGSLYDRMATPP